MYKDKNISTYKTGHIILKTIAGGCKNGMVHISQICNERIDSIEPHVNIGDEVIVKIIKIDERGRVKLTIKGVSEEEKAGVQER